MMKRLSELLQAEPQQLSGLTIDEQWHELFHHFSQQLSALKRGSGQRIILTPSSLTYFSAALWAIWRQGHIAVLPANTQHDTLCQLQSSCQAMIADESFIASTDLVLPIIFPQKNNGASETPISALSADQICLEIYTSGSSGEPKAITRSLAQLEAEVQQLQTQFDATLADAEVIATVPLQHIYGLIFRVLWPLCSARHSANEAQVYPEALIATISTAPKAKSLILISSPAHLERLAAHYDVEKIAPYLAVVFSSGAPLSRDSALALQRQWQQAPIEVLGSTETGGVAWRQRHPDESEAQRDVWQAFASVGLSLDADSVLQVSSPAAMSSTACAMGDRAELLSPTQFRLLGRVDRIIKLEGKRLSLTQMENYLRQYGGVKSAAICVLAGEREQLAAVLVLNDELSEELARNGKRSLNEKFKHYLLNQFERVTLPRYFRYVERLPVDARGKTTAAQLQALFTVNQNEIG